jgi:hypothetical protein
MLKKIIASAKTGESREEILSAEEEANTRAAWEANEAETEIERQQMQADKIRQQAAFEKLTQSLEAEEIADLKKYLGVG